MSTEKNHLIKTSTTNQKIQIFNYHQILDLKKYVNKDSKTFINTVVWFGLVCGMCEIVRVEFEIVCWGGVATRQLTPS